MGIGVRRPVVYLISPAQVHLVPSARFPGQVTQTPRAPGLTGWIFLPHFGQQYQVRPSIFLIID